MRRDGRFAHSSRAQEDTLFVAGSNNNVDYITMPRVGDSQTLVSRATRTLASADGLQPPRENRKHNKEDMSTHTDRQEHRHRHTTDDAHTQRNTTHT